MIPVGAKKNSLVIVEWLDTNSGCEWEDPEELENWEPALCYSVGWIINENDDYVVILADHSEAGRGRHEKPGYGGHRAIPRGCIKRVRRIKA